MTSWALSWRKKQAVDAICKLKKRAPPCFLFNLVAAWCNGWATADRFQSYARCCLHAQCQREDSLLHYLACSFHLPLLGHRTRLSYERYASTDLLCLGSQDENTLVLLAIHLYAINRAATYGRYNGACTDNTQLENLLWGFHKVAAAQSRSVRKLYRSIWCG